jgi:hypothetical protein
MAALTGPVVLAQGGGSGQPRWALLAFQKVTTADTFDASTLATPFSVVTGGTFFATSNRTETVTVSTIASSTIVSLLGTGVAADSGILAIVGE